MPVTYIRVSVKLEPMDENLQHHWDLRVSQSASSPSEGWDQPQGHLSRVPPHRALLTLAAPALQK